MIFHSQQPEIKQKPGKAANYYSQSRSWDQGDIRLRTGAYQVKKAIDSNKTDHNSEKIVNALFVSQDTFGNDQYLPNQNINEL